MRNKHKNRGFITVFVALMMVPVVVCTGTMVDVARLKLYSSQAAMAADSYGEVVLSEYDNLLKELYGLFSVTQNKEGLQAIEDFQKYTRYSFAPNGDNEKLQGFMPYENAKVEVSYTNVDGASLANNNVLMMQISDFMKFRVIEEIMEEKNILNVLEKFDSMSNDMDVVNERNKITKSSSEVLEKIGEYFEVLECINDYPDYLNERLYYYEGYSAELLAIYESEEYAGYVNYLNNKDAIDQAKSSVEEAENSAEDENSSGSSEEDQELAEQYMDVDAYKEQINSQLQSWETGLNKTEKRIEFGEAGKKLKELDKISKKLEATLTNLEQQISRLQSKLEGCSEDVRGEIEEEIRDLRRITDIASDFRDTVNLFYQNDISNKDQSNQDIWNRETETLSRVKDNLLEGKQEAYDWEESIEFDWYDFQKDKSHFYSELEALCKGKDGSGGSKKAADEKIDHAEGIQKSAQNEIQGDEETDARNISNSLALQLEIPGNSAEIPDLDDCFSGGASFASVGNGLIGKFLLTTYDFGMFSSRVSGIKPPEEHEDNVSQEDTEENAGNNVEYYDESLTKIRMSKDVNYLYGTELEYLLAGNNKSVDNLNYTRNIICGVRMTTNYLSSYSISEINKTINRIAKAAAAAVVAASGGTAAASEPLIRVAVSGALRLAFATLESVNDWKLLKDRENVIFYKREFGDLTTAPDVIAGLLGESVSGDKKSSDISLSYEDYMYVLLCLFTDEDTLLDRTSNLITLNVNQSQNEEDELSFLKFKMSDTVTAVKSTCKINEKFLIVPEQFVNMYLSGTETGAMIQKLDNGFYGYSVIRGY